MLQRCLALCLTCVLLLALSIPASAARVGDGSGQPQSATGNSTATVPGDRIISFDEIRGRVWSNNLTLKSARESLKSAQAMDWDEAIGEMADAIDDLEDQIELMTTSSKNALLGAQAAMTQVFNALLSAKDTIQGTEDSLEADGLSETFMQAINMAITGNFAQMQVATLESTLESMEEQLEDLKEQKEDYQKTLEDTEQQIDYAANQTVAGAESLYLTILSTELQLEGLKESQEATQRTLEEVQLRYDLGQVSQLTLLQTENASKSVDNSVASLENTISTLYSSLQSLLGDTPTGQMTLTTTPSVTDRQIAGISYNAGLSRAKENSYTLYSSARSVENAEEEMNDALRDEGKDSYQYEMAAYAYQSAVYQDQAAIAQFELSFQNLYKAIAPAQATLKDKENSLAYEEQVYAAAEKKHELGLLSDNGLLEAQITLHTAQRDVQSAKLDLFTAYHSYNQAVQYGLVSSS